MPPPPNPAMGNFKSFAPPTWNGMRPPVPIDMSKYKTGNNPRTTGTMNVSDAINAGSTVHPWAPSSGAGPGTRGYQGSYGGGFGRGGYGGGDNGFKTKRPSASNSAEYYALRDAAIGNPIQELKDNGPNRGAYADAIMAEAGGGDVSWQSNESDNTFFSGGGNGKSMDQGHGTKIENGVQVPMTAEDMAQVQADSTGMTIPGVGSSMFSRPKSSRAGIPLGIAKPFDFKDTGVRTPSQVIQGFNRPSPLSPFGNPVNPFGEGSDFIATQEGDNFTPEVQTSDEALLYEYGPKTELEKETIRRMREDEQGYLTTPANELLDKVLSETGKKVRSGTHTVVKPFVDAAEGIRGFFSPTFRKRR